jgi:SAM-dependent methyltransferase
MSKEQQNRWNAWHWSYLGNPYNMHEALLADSQVNLPVKNFLSGLLGKNGNYLLDIGSSPLSFTYIPKGQKVVSLDWAYLALNGKEKVLANALNLPFPSSSFPAVLSKQVYQYIDHPDIFLDEMVRVLKPGGLFILIDGEFLRLLEGRNVRTDNLVRELKLKPNELFEKLRSRGIEDLGFQRLFTLKTSFSEVALTAVYGKKAG